MPRHGPNAAKNNGYGAANFRDVLERGGSHKCRRTNGLNSQLEDALWNDADPTHLYKKELPVHRQIVEMARLGYDRNEISATTGRHQATVGRVLRQPFAREYMIREIKNNTADEIKQALEAFAPQGVNNLISMATDTKLKESNPKLFSDINDSLVTRVLGKPVQPLAHSHTVDPDSLSDEELAARAMTGPAPGGTPCPHFVDSENPAENDYPRPPAFPTSVPPIPQAVNGNGHHIIAPDPSTLSGAEFPSAAIPHPSEPPTLSDDYS